MKSLLEIENPTVEQLIYMKDLYDKETLIQYIACRWEYKINYGKMQDGDREKFHTELDTLGINIFEVFSEMNDYCLT